MASKGEPMTEQELAEIRRNVELNLVWGVLRHRRALLAEVDRLKAERDAAVRELEQLRSRRQPFGPERERVRRDHLHDGDSGTISVVDSKEPR